MPDNKIELPTDRRLATKIVEAQTLQAMRSIEMGTIGKFFGSRENAALYLTSGLMLTATIGLAVLAVVHPDARGELTRVLAAVVIGALGFIGGLLSGGKH